jgi:polyhydroxyalkanoate synthesis regulator phasin
MALVDILRNALLAGFGVQEKVKEFVDELVKKGELNESQGAKLVKEWADKAEKNTEDITNSLNDLVKKTIDKMKFPLKEDVDKLTEQVTILSERIKKLEETTRQNP